MQKWLNNKKIWNTLQNESTNDDWEGVEWRRERGQCPPPALVMSYAISLKLRKNIVFSKWVIECRILSGLRIKWMVRVFVIYMLQPFANIKYNIVLFLKNTKDI